MSEAVAIIELGDSHVECIYSQVLFLKKGGYRVHVICSEGIREQVEQFDYVDAVQAIGRGRGFSGHWRCVLAARRYIVQQGIRTVVFNTGGGNHTRDLTVILPPRVRLLGILHHTHKLKTSFTQFLISLRLRKYFVLNDYLFGVLPRSGRMRFESTYLIFREPMHTHAARKGAEELWVAIPGEVDFRRRAYASLIEELVNAPPDPRLRFMLLGRCKNDDDGRRLRTMIGEAGLDDRFVLFDKFLDPSEFFSYLAGCDVFLPLVHPSIAFFTFYHLHQVSGTYNLSFGFAVPLVLHTSLRGPEDFDIAAFFYEDGELTGLLHGLASKRDHLDEKARAIRSHPKFSFDFQCEKYLRFLRS